MEEEGEREYLWRSLGVTRRDARLGMMKKVERRRGEEEREGQREGKTREEKRPPEEAR